MASSRIPVGFIPTTTPFQPRSEWGDLAVQRTNMSALRSVIAPGVACCPSRSIGSCCCMCDNRKMMVSFRVIFPSVLLPSSTATLTSQRRMRRGFASLASGEHRVDTEKLRTELDQLHIEAEITREKASNARLRLMRLSEAAENLQRRAASTVMNGKENEARELLAQKKKLMQALEKSKNRIEVLDKLLTKINQAISLKETQLIGNVALHPEHTKEDSSHPIRFIYPKEVINENSKESGVCTASGEKQEQKCQTDEENLPAHLKQPISEDVASTHLLNNDVAFGNLKDMSSYKDFMEYVDDKLRDVETDIIDFLRLSTMVLDRAQKQTNTKVRQTSEILKDLQSIRERIASITKD